MGRGESVEPAGRGGSVISLAGAVSAGVGLAVQSRLNGELGSRVGDGITATLASTSVGLLLLLAIVPLFPAGRRGLGLVRTAVRTGGLRGWHLTGGVCGAVFVASQGISVGSLGVAVFTVAVVGGSAIGGLIVDRFWGGDDTPRPITVARTAGAAACVAAVAIAGNGAWGGSGTLALVILPVFAGVAIATQSALNGRVGAIAGSPWPATLINFSVAAGSLALALVLRAGFGGALPGHLPAEPLLYLAGVIGMGVVAVATTVVRRIGVLVFGLASVAGQLLGAVLLDALTPGPRPSAATFVGVAITFAALVLAAHPRFRRSESVQDARLTASRPR
ncbi:DMT family transporter [Amycolatopsis thailandensis]|uniref:DMT family transporter n=1 Tax=Amycolatopsis thailandensis TaxID=589330 RepID=UPI003645564A